MPGKIAVFQNNSDQHMTLTKHLNEDKRIQFIVNRDQANHADGTGFFDDGESLSQLTEK